MARIASSDPNAEFTISVDAGTDLSVKVEPLEYEQDYDIAVVCVDGNGDEGLPSPTITITIPCGSKCLRVIILHICIKHKIKRKTIKTIFWNMYGISSGGCNGRNRPDFTMQNKN